MGGIFWSIAGFAVSGHYFPWERGDPSADQRTGTYLDRVYHGVRSGSKFITDLLYHCLTEPLSGFNNDLPFLYDRAPDLRFTVSTYYYDKWKHLWDDYAMQYNALHSYSISDTESIAESETRTPNIIDETTILDSQNDSESETRTPNLTDSLQVAGTDTRTPATTESENVTETRNTKDETTYGKANTTQGQETGSASHSVYGFNSSQAVPKEETGDTRANGQTSTDSGKDTLEQTGSVTTTRQIAKGGTDTDAYTEASERKTTGTDQTSKTGTRQRSGSNTTRRTGTESTSGSRSLMRTRTGNIFKSPAELLSADREFWMTHYFEIVFEDMDKILTLSIMSERDANFKVY